MFGLEKKFKKSGAILFAVYILLSLFSDVCMILVSTYDVINIVFKWQPAFFTYFLAVFKHVTNSMQFGICYIGEEIKKKNGFKVRNSWN